jgi:hypothetical protein
MTEVAIVLFVGLRNRGARGAGLGEHSTERGSQRFIAIWTTNSANGST